MAAASTAALDARIMAAQRQMLAVRVKLLTYIAALWAAQGQYRDAQQAGFARAAVVAVTAAQVTMSRLTAVYLADMVSRETGRVVAPATIPASSITTTELRGVDSATEVYGRPFVTVWTALSEGKPLEQAVEMGAKRATDLAATDVQLAKTHTAQRSMAREPAVVGYRRVLTNAKACGLCVVASTQRYHKADLLPIHPGCDCGIAQIIGTKDPGHVIDEQRLAQAHAAIAERFGTDAPDARDIDYRQVLVTHHHGEIGPVLAVRGQRFTGPPGIPS